MGWSELVQRQKVEINVGMMDKLSPINRDGGDEEDDKADGGRTAYSRRCKRVVTCP